MIKPIPEIHVRLSNDAGGRTLVVDTASERAQRYAWECLKKFSSWAYSAFERNAQQVINVSPCYDMSEVVAYIKNVPGIEELVVTQYKPRCFQIDCASERAAKWASECQRKFDVMPGWRANDKKPCYTIHIAPRFSAEEVEAYIKNVPWLRELRAERCGTGITIFADSERAVQWALECQKKFGTRVNKVNTQDFFIPASPLWNTDAVLEYINNPPWLTPKFVVQTWVDGIHQPQMDRAYATREEAERDSDNPVRVCGTALGCGMVVIAQCIWETKIVEQPAVEMTIKRCPNPRAIWVTIHTKQAEDWLRSRAFWFVRPATPEGQHPKNLTLEVSQSYNFETIFADIAAQPWCKAV